MRSVIKSKPNQVEAWQLGKNTPMEEALIRSGKIRRISSEKYELFSQESRGEAGQIAFAGDYFKVDASGYPYPNTRAFFEENHVWVSGDTYHQLPKKRQAWFMGDPTDEVIAFLQAHKDLRLHETEGFRAGELSADPDAALLIYSVDRDSSGRILDVDFNFVAQKEFALTYQLL